MSILVNKDTKVLVQGITGQSGQRAVEVMQNYGTQVLAGVTPGKGGQKVKDVPVFNTVYEAKRQFPKINTTSIQVPPLFAKDAILEAIDNGIELIHVFTERIPIQDTSYCLSYAQEKNVCLVGPASVGVLSPAKGLLGVVGGSTPEKVYQPGPIGIISKSGGMTNELAWIVRQAGLGQSTVVGIGGDYLVGSDFADLLLLFESDPQTKGVIIFSEVGSQSEIRILELRKQKKLTKPVAIFFAGKFAQSSPEGMTIGHAGAIIQQGQITLETKERALKQVGIKIANKYEELPRLIKSEI